MVVQMCKLLKWYNVLLEFCVGSCCAVPHHICMDSGTQEAVGPSSVSQVAYTKRGVVLILRHYLRCAVRHCAREALHVTASVLTPALPCCCARLLTCGARVWTSSRCRSGCTLPKKI